MENQSRTGRKKIIPATLTNFFVFLHRGTLHSSSHLPNKHAHTKKPFKTWAIQEIRSVFEYQKQHPHKDMAMARRNLKPATLIRFHIFLEDCYAEPLLRDGKTLLSWFKFDQRIKDKVEQTRQRIRAEQIRRDPTLQHPTED